MAHSDPTTSTPHADRLREAVQAGLPAAIADLSQLVRLPSVAWPGFDHSHVRASAEAVAALAEDLGVFDSVQVVQVPIDSSDAAPGERLGQPAVLATRAARNGKPTILLYAHHDVQPPGQDEDWDSQPYEPTLRGERLYGRGTADDKAGVILHVASIRALTSIIPAADLELGLVLFAEGEEEYGSRSFPVFLDRYREQLRADAILVADSGNWDTETPGLTVALRGAVAFNLRISTLDHASHSGMFGGAVPDAMTVAIKLLASFWHKDGSVKVEGLRDHEAATPEYDEEKLRNETGLLEGVEPIGHGEILHRMWFQPTVTVTGIDAPTVMNASNTLVPSVRVRISARVAPGQSAREAFDAIEAHILEHTPYGAQLQFEDIDLGQPFLVDTDGWAVEDTLETMEEAWGREAVEMGAGGSIPFIADLVEKFPGAQILITGVEDPDTRAHSPNESVHLPSLHRAILSQTFLLSRINARG